MSKRRAPETPIENKKPKLSAKEQRRKAADWAAANLQLQSSATKTTRRNSTDDVQPVPPSPAQEPPTESEETKKKPRKRLSEAAYFAKAKEAKVDNDTLEIAQSSLSVSSTAPSVNGRSSRPSTSGGLQASVAPEEPFTPSRRPTRRSIAPALASSAPIVESAALTPAKVSEPPAATTTTRTSTIPAVTLSEPPGEVQSQSTLVDAPVSTVVTAYHHHDWEDRLHGTLAVIFRLLCFVLVAMLLYSQDFRLPTLCSIGFFAVFYVLHRLFLFWTHRGAGATHATTDQDRS